LGIFIAWPDPVLETTRVIGLYSWLTGPICLLASQGLWFWCKRAHRERTSLKPLVLMVVWAIVGYFAVMFF
jgi:hypothetical protein